MTHKKKWLLTSLKKKTKKKTEKTIEDIQEVTPLADANRISLMLFVLQHHQNKTSFSHKKRRMKQINLEASSWWKYILMFYSSLTLTTQHQQRAKSLRPKVAVNKKSDWLLLKRPSNSRQTLYWLLTRLNRMNLGKIPPGLLNPYGSFYCERTPVAQRSSGTLPLCSRPMTDAWSQETVAGLWALCSAPEKILNLQGHPPVSYFSGGT